MNMIFMISVLDTSKLVHVRIKVAVKSPPLNYIDEALIFLPHESRKYSDIHIGPQFL